MKVIIVGAGGQGGACASILASQDTVEEIRLVDMVMPWMVTHVMEGALKAKAIYINTEFDAPYWNEFMRRRRESNVRT